VDDAASEAENSTRMTVITMIITAVATLSQGRSVKNNNGTLRTVTAEAGSSQGHRGTKLPILRNKMRRGFNIRLGQMFPILC
jgi:hypothetical protein